MLVRRCPLQRTIIDGLVGNACRTVPAYVSLMLHKPTLLSLLYRSYPLTKDQNIAKTILDPKYPYGGAENSKERKNQESSETLQGSGALGTAKMERASTPGHGGSQSPPRAAARVPASRFPVSSAASGVPVCAPRLCQDALLERSRWRRRRRCGVVGLV